MKKLIKVTALLAVLTIPTIINAASQADEGKCWLWQKGRIIREINLSELEYYTREGYYGLQEWPRGAWSNPDASDAGPTYSFNFLEIDSLTFFPSLPKADLLDLSFNADGTAVDKSPMHHTITQSSEVPAIHYNRDLGAYVACFNNLYPRGGQRKSPAQWYKFDYADNPDFINKLKDGHTLEILLKPTHDGKLSDLLRYMENNTEKQGEAKFFSTHQDGGTGFLITKTERGNKFAFLPNISTNSGSNYIWTEGQSPETRNYYHLIGVWDKETQKAQLYINGQKVSEIDAGGELVMAKNVTAFCIGCDSKPNNGVEDGFDGEIAFARIYDNALNTTEVGVLYNNVKYTVERSQNYPVADLLNVVWWPDQNEFFDASYNYTQQQVAYTINSGSDKQSYSPEFDLRYLTFDQNTWGEKAAANDGTRQWQRVQYTDDWYKNLQDGHSMEVLIKPDINVTTTPEVKPMSTTQGGGVAIMVSTAKTLNYLAHNGSWQFCDSRVAPLSDVYYHVIGVYDKSAQKTRIYLNGKYCGEKDFTGSLTMPNANADNILGIGGDPGNIKANSFQMEGLFRGDILIARIYNEPLTDIQADRLWREVECGMSNSALLISSVRVLQDVEVKPGVKFPIYGTGWQNGDQVTFSGSNGVFTVSPTSIDSERAVFTLPAITSGQYTISLTRGSEAQSLGSTTLTTVTELPQGCRVVCHRGVHDNGAYTENSRAALRKGLEGDYYAVECDIYKSADGYLYVIHDSKVSGIDGYHFQKNWSDIKNYKLGNQETMPLLVDFFEILKESTNKNTKLIVEIKTQLTDAATQSVATAAMDAAEIRGVSDRVEFIAFNYAACQTIANRGYKVSYLCGNDGVVRSPSTLKSAGISGLDYIPSKITWSADDIRAAGITSNVWTIDSESDIARMNKLGYDFLTTNNPELAQLYYRYYNENQ